MGAEREQSSREGGVVPPRWEKESPKFLIPNFTLILTFRYSIKREERTIRKK